ncbi:chloride channel protein 2-like isoform X2 [Xenia sp. Carnegie-2017]|uniref:chloride channel protein 2-like isoform X2 n=1 Tax=Xenia sp. Carnegie-2017 TaxID=2897299 RepID=UPI001F03F6D3|nr:chloride channel protein 2-like isoform X2 [Xenia sp. Carnegie-2017]
MSGVEDEQSRYNYQETLMYGSHTAQELQDYAKNFAAELRSQTSQDETAPLEPNDDHFHAYSTSRWGIIRRQMKQVFLSIEEKFDSDWLFLLVLGIIVALISFGLDYSIDKCQQAHFWMYSHVSDNVFVQYLLWVFFPVSLIFFSVGFTHLVSPHAIGSGIPEMKTILRGTVLKRYLSIPTLISKVIGLTASIGSGIPIGKEGPFVHIACIVARALGKFVTSFKGIFMNESRNTEILAAACALGVSSCFASPIGGVLFSIEVTSTYFAVRNYWRGFFAAVCGAFVFSLLSVWDNEEETITALFKTNFRIEFPFDTEEFIAFSLIGVFCGFGGALFVYTHRKIVDIRRDHRDNPVSRFLEKSRFLYPVIVTLLVSTIMFPPGPGRLIAGELTQKQAIEELFSNTTWSLGESEDSDVPAATLKHWNGAFHNIYVTLVFFIVFKFVMTAIAITLPVPAGIFFPVFVIGAAFGRLVGEAMATWFPDGIHDKGPNDVISKILPGGYAVVGAAAMSGAVTHTISVSVIVFELTGQIAHILPVMVAVLIANGIAQWLQPSIYDSIIQIKKLPYLPEITNSRLYKITVANIMKTDLKFITRSSTYGDLKHVLNATKLTSFPLVDSKETMTLLGSIRRTQLQMLLTRYLSRAKQEANSRAESEVGSSPSSSSTTLLLERRQNGSEFDNDESCQNETALQPSSSNTSLLERIPGSLQLQRLFNSSSTSLDSQTRTSSPNSARNSMSQEQFLQWEKEILEKEVDYDLCQIDAAPFQLVERTSLLKVHKLFALLNLSHAYVTSLGRLVGVVALTEIRQTVEGSEMLYDDHHDSDSGPS